MKSKVNLISITPEAEKHIMYCARVSNPKNQNSANTSLLHYCIKHGHWSIFEQAHMTLEITTSRGISAQLLRHRSFCFQEFSQRYSKSQDFIIYEARRQDLKNRQNSVDNLSENTKYWFELAQKDLIAKSTALYEQALNMGIAKEQARFLLPLSTQTKLYMSGNIRSWMHYIDLRSANGTQKEHQEIALQCKEIFKKELPNISKALKWN